MQPIMKKDTKRMSYLNHIDLPEIDADVKLLIGTNTSKLHEPWDIVNGQGDGPFAIKTLLGWVVNGSRENSNDGVIITFQL